MKLRENIIKVLLCLAISFLFCQTPPAAVFYVNVNSANPVPPYASWSTAATTIQDAVNDATNGDFIWVTNGIYQTGGQLATGSATTNRVAITQSITVQSVNGPGVTVIQGYQIPVTTNGTGAIRCVYLTNGATLSGFTLTNGATVSDNGGGVYCLSSVASIANCLITGNSASSSGGGGYQGSYNNCTILANTCHNNGGGAYGGYFVNSVIAGNFAQYGGGVYNPMGMVNCTVVNNAATQNGGGGVYLINGDLYNCIIYNNTNSTSDPQEKNVSSVIANSVINCCTTPTNNLGPNNITNLPALIDWANGNYHLQIGSPCINAGNNSFAGVGTDLDGNPRISGGQVDLGAYESDYTNVVHYVSLTSTNPVAPYTNWATAATNLQTAISVAQPGEVVAANAGIYNQGSIVVSGLSANRVAVTNGIMLLATYGPQATYILGASQVRCAYVDASSVLVGFTLTNGFASSSGNTLQDESGGDLWCASPSTLISNCVMTTGLAYYGGGGAYSGTLVNCTLTRNYHCTFGGGAFYSTLNHCILTQNTANYGGGACSNILFNSLVASNSANFSGGGVISSFVTNSTFYNNSARSGGGAANGQLTGCTLTNNTASNGGATASNTLYNCLLAYNQATNNGGGAYNGGLNACTLFSNVATNSGGGAYNVTLTNCTLFANWAGTNGGAVGVGTLISCLIYSNSATYGGGVYLAAITNCMVSANHASYGGGAALGSSSGCGFTNNSAALLGGGVYSNIVFDCQIISNSVGNGVGGGSLGSVLNRCLIAENNGGGSADDTLYNCIIANNFNGDGAGGSTLNNCTVVNPLISGHYGINYCWATNCIIYGNFSGARMANYTDPASISYCCITPLPPSLYGTGNFTNAPIFADNYFHLATNSPCIGAGNINFAPGPVDYDGRPRTINGAVDVGATEFQGATVEPFISWLDQYGLPDDGSVDDLDSDGTGLNNYQKWLAGLNPTNPASVLQMTAPATTNNSSGGFTITWQSVTNVTYYLQRSPTLSPPAFTAIQSNLVGQAGTTSFTDTTATNGAAFFYRIAVQ